MKQKIQKVESNSLKVGIAINLIMAIGGWIAYHFTNSEAVLLDANYTFIIVIATIAAIVISKHKHKKSEVFPFGGYVFESLFVLVKGIMIFLLTTTAMIQSVAKILDYFNGGEYDMIEYGLIIPFTIFMVVLSFGLAIFYKMRNKRIEGKSPILKVETTTSIIDGYFSLSVGIALILMAVVPERSFFGFLLYVGDSVIVIIMSLALIKTPLVVIRNAFIEISGGTLQDKEAKEKIEQTIEEFLPEKYADHENYITKVGSSYLAVIYLSPKEDVMSRKELGDIRQKILDQLTPDFPSFEVELTLR